MYFSIFLSIFLSTRNRHHPVYHVLQTVNPAYKANLMKLKNLVLVKFLQDTMVDPKESEVSEVKSVAA